MRIPVNERATLLLGHMGSAAPCTLLDLCLDGCRVRTDAEIRTERNARVEMVFRIGGMAFRLNGVLEWSARTREFGVSFTGMSPRAEADLVEVLGELAAKWQAKQAETARGDAAMRLARELVERLTAEFETASARAEAAQAEAAQAARAALEAGARLESAKRALADSETAGSRAGEVANVLQNAGGEQPGAQVTQAAPSRRERRQATRHAVDTEATVFLVEVRSNVRGRILDVSTSGCRIRFAERFPVGIYRRVEVEFTMDGLPFRLPGVVQSIHDPFTAGIRFQDLSERKQKDLGLLIEEIGAMRQESGHGAVGTASAATG